MVTHLERSVVLAMGAAFSSRSALTKRELAERPITEYVDVIQEVARNETQQAQMQMTKPEPHLVEGIDEMRS